MYASIHVGIYECMYSFKYISLYVCMLQKCESSIKILCVLERNKRNSEALTWIKHLDEVEDAEPRRRGPK